MVFDVEMLADRNLIAHRTAQPQRFTAAIRHHPGYIQRLICEENTVLKCAFRIWALKTLKWNGVGFSVQKIHLLEGSGCQK